MFKVFKFCRSKCHKLFKHKKNPRRTRWTKAFRKANNKELTFDPTFEFERKRNVPTKYNRELWSNTVKAMKRVEEIKQKRQANFMMARFKKANEIEREHDRRIVKRDMALIKSPAAGLKRPLKAKIVVEEEEEEESDEGMQDQESSEEEEAMVEVN